MTTIKNYDHLGKRFLRGALLLASFLALINACSPPATPAPKALTQARLKHVNYVVSILEKERQEDLSKRLHDSTNMNEIVFSMILEVVINEGIDKKTAMEQLCYDGYGRKFNVGIKSNLVARGASPALVSASTDIIVWSSGINGQNDLGWNDDIVLDSSHMPAK